MHMHACAWLQGFRIGGQAETAEERGEWCGPWSTAMQLIARREAALEDLTLALTPVPTLTPTPIPASTPTLAPALILALTLAPSLTLILAPTLALTLTLPLPLTLPPALPLAPNPNQAALEEHEADQGGEAPPPLVAWAPRRSGAAAAAAAAAAARRAHAGGVPALQELCVGFLVANIGAVSSFGVLPPGAIYMII